jgi:hypothetical protein
MKERREEDSERARKRTERELHERKWTNSCSVVLCVHCALYSQGTV